MKISVNETGEIEFEDVFNAIVIKTEHGRFGIAQRDGGIEIVRDHKTVYVSTPAPSSSPSSVKMRWQPGMLSHDSVSIGEAVHKCIDCKITGTVGEISRRLCPAKLDEWS